MVFKVAATTVWCGDNVLIMKALDFVKGYLKIFCNLFYSLQYYCKAYNLFLNFSYKLGALYRQKNTPFFGSNTFPKMQTVSNEWKASLSMKFQIK